MPRFPNVEAEINDRLKHTNKARSWMGYNYYICPICCREFCGYDAKSWVYRKQKRGAILTFCGYACMRKAETMPFFTDKRETKSGSKKKGKGNTNGKGNTSTKKPDEQIGA